MITDAEKQMIAVQNMCRSDRQNNERWAYMIKKYWASRGRDVKAQAVHRRQTYTDDVGQIRSRLVWCVETDMIGGLPV